MVALLIDVDAAGQVSAAGVAVGSCSACAKRLRTLEARLLGMRLQSLAQLRLNAADLAPLSPIDDVRASAAYRLDATATLLQRALRELAR
jgi:CO/xanthine dehydrogenase FAD-binding subunit